MYKINDTLSLKNNDSDITEISRQEYSYLSVLKQTAELLLILLLENFIYI